VCIPLVRVSREDPLVLGGIRCLQGKHRLIVNRLSSRASRTDLLPSGDTPPLFVITTADSCLFQQLFCFVDSFSSQGTTHRARPDLWGGISTQRLLPYGSPEEIKRVTRETIKILGSGGGYIAAPTHAIPGDVPPENVLAMIEVFQNQ